MTERRRQVLEIRDQVLTAAERIASGKSGGVGWAMYKAGLTSRDIRSFDHMFPRVWVLFDSDREEQVLMLLTFAEFLRAGGELPDLDYYGRIWKRVGNEIV